MIDEDKLKNKIEGLKSNLIHGACSSQIAMETRCKEEAYNEVLAIIDSMQEESVVIDAPSEDYVKGFADGRLYQQRQKEEPVREDLEEAASFYANTHTEWFDHEGNPHVAPAFKAGANWQKKCLMKDAVDGEIGYWNIRGLSVNMDLPRTLEEGDKVKLIIIKEDKV